MAFETGKLGKVTITVTDISINGWTFDFEEESADTTSTGDAGYASSVGGIISGRGTFTAYWNTASHPTDNPPNLRPGVVPTHIILYLGDPANNKFFDVTSGRINGVSVSSPLRGAIAYTCTFEATGSWTYPV